MVAVKRLHVRVEGEVQGVGFRYGTYRQAIALGLNGWVRNLPDGSVEAEFEGDPLSLERMLEWCRRGPRWATVVNVDATWDEGEPRYSGFSITG